ncbi:MAG: hypothetical protein HY796_04035 [Elusimicrobia bacterium]|nr:hypothetical protein [Elusimicrobiota bacterium]
MFHVEYSAAYLQPIQGKWRTFSIMSAFGLPQTTEYTRRNDLCRHPGFIPSFMLKFQ